MITFEVLCTQVAGLQPADLRRWIENAWVRPLATPATDQVEIWQFEEIDVARVRLIVELRDELRVEEDTLPVVLSLLDQVHDLRRRLVTLQAAISEVAPAEVHDNILKVLRRADPGG
jgi:chaperone modulatory protein CbpM